MKITETLCCYRSGNQIIKTENANKSHELFLRQTPYNKRCLHNKMAYLKKCKQKKMPRKRCVWIIVWIWLLLERLRENRMCQKLYFDPGSFGFASVESFHLVWMNNTEGLLEFNFQRGLFVMLICNKTFLQFETNFKKLFLLFHINREITNVIHNLYKLNRAVM